MSAVCLYFQVHQPRRVRRYRVFDIGHNHSYFDDSSDSNLNNQKILLKVAHKCYLPTNEILLSLLKQYPEFRISFSFSGIFLEQLQEYSPETLSSFQRLVSTGRAEVLEETYYHSLSFLYSRSEFDSQVKLHKNLVRKLFKVTPRIFRNTELIYNNELAAHIENLGYSGILAEGADRILDWRSPNFLYSPEGTKKIKLFLKNYRLSDDIAFRFSDKSWSEHPLAAPKFAKWIEAVNGNGDLVNLFMDYETFGEHQWADTGIFEFLKELPKEILSTRDGGFVTPSEALKLFPSRGTISVDHFISWADVERDLTAWLGNPIQDDAASRLYALESAILESRDVSLVSDWRRLQTSDHFYYMCTKWFADGDVHKYFNPYESPYEAFISFMNVLADLRLRLESVTEKSSPHAKSISSK